MWTLCVEFSFITSSVVAPPHVNAWACTPRIAPDGGSTFKRRGGAGGGALCSGWFTQLNPKDKYYLKKTTKLKVIHGDVQKGVRNTRRLVLSVVFCLFVRLHSCSFVLFVFFVTHHQTPDLSINLSCTSLFRLFGHFCPKRGKLTAPHCDKQVLPRLKTSL